MRLGPILFPTLIAILAADVQSAAAQESFFNERYCTRRMGFSMGAGLDCAYHTWRQCMASAQGLGRYCTENPFWRPKAPVPNQRAPRSRYR